VNLSLGKSLEIVISRIIKENGEGVRAYNTNIELRGNFLCISIGPYTVFSGYIDLDVKQ